MVMVEIRRENHLGCIFSPVNNGIFTISAGAGFLPSTVLHVAIWGH